MITIIKIVTAPTGENVIEMRGLSTDTKPINKIKGYKVGNSSTYYEINTGKLYMFNGTSSVWIEQ